jgi:hypothetical protein
MLLVILKRNCEVVYITIELDDGFILFLASLEDRSLLITNLGSFKDKSLVHIKGGIQRATTDTLT